MSMWYIVTNKTGKIKPREEYVMIDCNDLSETRVKGKMVAFADKLNDALINVDGNRITKLSNEVVRDLSNVKIEGVNINYGEDVFVSASNKDFAGVADSYGISMVEGVVYTYDRNMERHELLGLS